MRRTFAIDYDLRNIVLKNSLEHSNEIGLGLGLANKKGIRTYDPITLDVSYVFGNDYDVVMIRLSRRY